uniref:Uncharacterized protein n=1 Tax=Caenorhabditis japonica TaxID=281687 RepID=A0A8R1E8F3_CAEJA
MKILSTGNASLKLFPQVLDGVDVGALAGPLHYGHTVGGEPILKKRYSLVKRHGPACGPLTAKRVHAWCTQRARGGPASGSLAATSRG